MNNTSETSPSFDPAFYDSMMARFDSQIEGEGGLVDSGDSFAFMQSYPYQIGIVIYYASTSISSIHGPVNIVHTP